MCVYVCVCIAYCCSKNAYMTQHLDGKVCRCLLLVVALNY